MTAKYLLDHSLDRPIGKQRYSLADLQRCWELCSSSRTSCAPKISSHHGVFIIPLAGKDYCLDEAHLNNKKDGDVTAVTDKCL